jgi:hypothetical protein
MDKPPVGLPMRLSIILVNNIQGWDKTKRAD